MKLSKQVVQWLTSLRMNKFKGEPRPHKPVLLLSVLELAEDGQLTRNEIPFGATLFEYFGEYWRAVAGDETGKIEYPFWYMKSEPFWTLVPLPGQDDTVRRKGSSPVSGKWLREHVEHARLDVELFEAMQDEEARDRMRGVLVAAYFPAKKEAVEEIRAFERSVYRYTQIIRRWTEPEASYRVAPEHVRDAAFRRVVTGAYDYTCAVSGVRLTLSAGGTYQPRSSCAHPRLGRLSRRQPSKRLNAQPELPLAVRARTIHAGRAVAHQGLTCGARLRWYDRRTADAVPRSEGGSAGGRIPMARSGLFGMAPYEEVSPRVAIGSLGRLALPLQGKQLAVPGCSESSSCLLTWRLSDVRHTSHGASDRRQLDVRSGASPARGHRSIRC